MPGTLTKLDIINALHRKNGVSRTEARDLVENLLKIVKTTLEPGEDVLISGFGKFCVKFKNERLGRNPATGSGMVLSPRKVVTFRCSGKLRDALNRK